MKINRLVVKNIGPIDDIDLTLDGKSVVFAGENGSGKTILISAVVDFIHEHLREVGFEDVMPQKGFGYSYFRMTSDRFKKSGQEKGFIWIDGNIGDEKIKYLECYGYSKEELSNYLKIPIKDVIFPDDGTAKKIGGITSKKQKSAAKLTIRNESIFYLPATRFEKEFWKTDAFANINFQEESKFSNSLGHNIELASSLRENYNWLLNLAMDMLLDGQTKARYKISGDFPSELSINEINNVIRLIFGRSDIRLVINKDYSDRLAVSDLNGNLVVSSLSMLSLGQLLTLDMFLNIMRFGHGKMASDICGVVIVDEIDTHLHIRLQNEVLPRLIKLFPKIQFIITTHSSMFLMGLKAQDVDTKIISLPDVQEISPDDFSELNVALEKIEQTKKYIASVNSKIHQETKPVLLVEDEYTEIYKVAWLKLNDINFDRKSLSDIFDKNCPFEIYGKNGKESLFKYLNQQKMDEIHDKRVVGLFDFDEAYNDFNGLKKGSRWRKEEGDDLSGIYKVRQDYPNISAMLIPVPDFRSDMADSTDLKERSLLEIELLFRDEKILNYCDRKKVAGGGEVLVFKSKNKKDFWKDTVGFKKNDFDAFAKLFELAEKLLDVNTKK